MRHAVDHCLLLLSYGHNSLFSSTPTTQPKGGVRRGREGAKVTVFATWTAGLIVHGGTVLDSQNKHHAGLFPNVANNPVIANTITPQPAKLMTQGLPEEAGFSSVAMRVSM